MFGDLIEKEVALLSNLKSEIFSVQVKMFDVDESCMVWLVYIVRRNEEIERGSHSCIGC